jgi:hypothetical protein
MSILILLIKNPILSMQTQFISPKAKMWVRIWLLEDQVTPLFIVKFQLLQCFMDREAVLLKE